MSFWTDERKRTTDTVHGVFSEPVTYTPRGLTPVLIDVPYRHDNVQQLIDANDCEVVSNRPKLSIPESFVLDLILPREPRKGDSWLVNGESFEVAKVEPPKYGYYSVFGLEIR